jgi:hypothetical protein
MALAGRPWRRAMTEFSGISGVKGRSFPPPSVDKQLPLPEKGVHPSYTPTGSLLIEDFHLPGQSLKLSQRERVWPEVSKAFQCWAATI